jgi:hypothetical protein
MQFSPDAPSGYLTPDSVLSCGNLISYAIRWTSSPTLFTITDEIHAPELDTQTGEAQLTALCSRFTG